LSYTHLAPTLRAATSLPASHWTHFSFHNTDLDIQLRQRNVTHIIPAGMETNTCLRPPCAMHMSWAIASRF